MSELVTSEFAPDEGKYRRKYGLDWPANMSDIQIELTCAKKWREPLFKQAGNLNDPYVHLLRVVRELFPATGTCPLVISPWTEEHAFDFTTRPFVITWGCASSSKSNDYGCFYVLDWGTDPHKTYSVVATTEKGMLLDRTFESILRYHSHLKGLRIGWPGKLSKARLAIINDEDDDDNPAAASTSTKAQIKGVAVSDGTEDEARAKLQGGHLPYVRQLGDELSQMRKAFMKVRSNLRAGSIDYRFHGLCNPDHLADLAAQHSVPLKGWTSIDTVNAREWETQYGWVRHHNGFQSPAVLEPDGATKYPYLINQGQLDEIIKDAGGNEDDPIVWTMARGHPAPQGRQSTVLTPQMYAAYRMGEGVIWRAAPRRIAFLDPAYTGDGDDCILYPGEVGWASSEDGNSAAVLTLLFLDPIKLRIEGSSQALVMDQIASQVIEHSRLLRFGPEEFGVDDSGIQNTGDVLASKFGAGLFRMRNNGVASDLPVSAFDVTPCSDKYYDQITEALYSLRAFAQHGQIRGLVVSAAEDLYNRRVNRKGLKHQAETKKDFKKRMQRSPDRGDAALGLVQVARHVLGFFPGATVMLGVQHGRFTEDNLPQVGNRFPQHLVDASNRLNAAHFASPEA